jgi:hypothetical protein
LVGDTALPLKMLVLKAVMCNLHLLSQHNDYLPPGLDDSLGIRLQLHTGIGGGRTAWNAGRRFPIEVLLR